MGVRRHTGDERETKCGPCQEVSVFSQEQQVQQVVAMLRTRFPRFAVATIERRVRAGFERYAGAPVQSFLPILVQREVEVQFEQAARLAAGDSVDVA
jgi:hypothetical protein